MLGWCVTQPGLFCSISQDHLVLDYVAFIFFLIFLGTLMDFWFKETYFPFHFQQIFYTIHLGSIHECLAQIFIP